MRFSGFEEVGKYDSYKKHLFEDIFLFSTGKNIKQDEASPEFEIPCVRYGELYHLYNEVISKVVNKTNLDKSELRFSDGNEILLPSAGEDPLDIGSASALTVKDVAIGRTINILKPARIDVYSPIYVSYYINQKLKKPISALSKGVSISNVYNSDLKTLKIILPNLSEQIKIAEFLSLINARIETQIQIIEELKSLKKVLRNNLCKQFTKIGKSEQIANLLNYEQPTNYIVANTNYSDDCSLIPVLTANKAFILGYTNEDFGIYHKGECVIFDDFTMDLKYVDFPFKVKSSAIKILTAKLGVNLRFIYEYLSFLKLTSADHKRHYISEIEPMCISVPKIDIQNNTANILSLLDEKIDLETKQYDLFVNQKKYLLSQMFI